MNGSPVETPETGVRFRDHVDHNTEIIEESEDARYFPVVDGRYIWVEMGGRVISDQDVNTYSVRVCTPPFAMGGSSLELGS